MHFIKKLNLPRTRQDLNQDQSNWRECLSLTFRAAALFSR